MKKTGKLVLVGAGAVMVAAAALAAGIPGGGEPATEAGTVEVVRGDVVDRALAVGTIEPEIEVEVKSKVSGVVRRAFADEGERVAAGAPLLEIRPDPTPIELVEARRQLELRSNDLDALGRERERLLSLHGRGLLSDREVDDIRRRFREAELQLEMARERLSLLETGKVTTAEGSTESVLRSPIAGFVLKRMVEVGDPVVPLSSYQEGTVLITMADMSRLIFRGTVDEIDVGRMREGMPVELEIGALPDARVRGVVSSISLKAEKDESATVFPVEVRITESGGVTLRAGFSANAEIILDERKDVLVVPERVVTFDDEGAWVEVVGADGTTERRAVRTGLSDAITVEVLDGLEQGDRVREKPVRTVQ